jgi:uncharacterized lipoprotein YajG
MSLNPKPPVKRFFTTGITLLSLHIFAGCGGGPVILDYRPSHESAFKLKSPAKIHIVPFKDSRGVENPALAGSLEETVIDIMSDRLILSEDVSTVVTDALAGEFTAAGFKVSAGPYEKPGDADLVLTGEVRKFWLHNREGGLVEIEIHSKIADGATEESLWSGTAKGMEGDFGGHTSESISESLVGSLKKAVGKIVEQGAVISGAREKYDSPTTPPAPPAPRIQTAPEGPTAAPPPAEALPAEGKGKIVITTDPARTKVYIGDVYYGRSPLSIDLKPGIYEVHVKKRGFKAETEKVAVRDGVTVELDVTLTK